MSALTPARDIDAARRRAERIRIKARNVTEQYADLRALVDEAERNEDHLTLGYQSWTAYVSDLFGEEPLRLPRDERIPMVQMLADKGMSTRAIGSMLGVHHDTVATDIRAGVGNPTPERINPATGEVVPGPTYRPTDVTDWTPQEVDDLIDADERELEAWKASTVPAPPKVVGLDGKTYARPEPKKTSKETTMTAAPSRLAIPQPPRYGGNRPKHAQIIRNAVLSASGLCIAMDEIQTLDQSIDNEEAARLADDLSSILRSLKRIQSLLKKEA